MDNIQMKEFYKEAENDLILLNCRFNGIEIYILNNMVEYLEKSLAYGKIIREELQMLDETFKELKDELTVEESIEVQIKFKNYYNLINKQFETNAVTNVIPSSMVVSLVSSFDYFIAKLIRLSYRYNTQIISAEKMNVSYQEIGLLESINDVKNYCIDKIVDLQFRDSHKALFDYIEKTFSIKGIKDISEYKNILLIAEMRNIIVHNDGFNNISFKNNIKSCGIKVDYNSFFDSDNKLKLINRKYIEFVRNNLICFYVKLFYLFIYHFCRRDNTVIENLSSRINDLALEYYEKKDYDIALSLFDFMLNNCNTSSEKFMFTINKCMCLKAQNKMEEVHSFLGDLDWSNCNHVYIFAKYLLLDDFDNVYEYIKKNPNGMEYKYQFWPLCKPLIQKPEFANLYRRLYGKEFQYKIRSGRMSKEEIKNIVQEINKIVDDSKLNKDTNSSENNPKSASGEILREEKLDESDDQSEN